MQHQPQLSPRSIKPLKRSRDASSSFAMDQDDKPATVGLGLGFGNASSPFAAPHIPENGGHERSYFPGTVSDPLHPDYKAHAAAMAADHAYAGSRSGETSGFATPTETDSNGYDDDYDIVEEAHAETRANGTEWPINMRATPYHGDATKEFDFAAKYFDSGHGRLDRLVHALQEYDNQNQYAAILRAIPNVRHITLANPPSAGGNRDTSRAHIGPAKRDGHEEDEQVRVDRESVKIGRSLKREGRWEPESKQAKDEYRQREKERLAQEERDVEPGFQRWGVRGWEEDTAAIALFNKGDAAVQEGEKKKKKKSKKKGKKKANNAQAGQEAGGDDTKGEEGEGNEDGVELRVAEEGGQPSLSASISESVADDASTVTVTASSATINADAHKADVNSMASAPPSPTAPIEPEVSPKELAAKRAEEKAAKLRQKKEEKKKRSAARKGIEYVKKEWVPPPAPETAPEPEPVRQPDADAADSKSAKKAKKKKATQTEQVDRVEQEAAPVAAQIEGEAQAVDPVEVQPPHTVARQESVLLETGHDEPQADQTAPAEMTPEKAIRGSKKENYITRSPLSGKTPLRPPHYNLDRSRSTTGPVGAPLKQQDSSVTVKGGGNARSASGPPSGLNFLANPTSLEPSRAEPAAVGVVGPARSAQDNATNSLPEIGSTASTADTIPAKGKPIEIVFGTIAPIDPADFVTEPMSATGSTITERQDAPTPETSPLKLIVKLPVEQHSVPTIKVDSPSSRRKQETERTPSPEKSADGKDEVENQLGVSYMSERPGTPTTFEAQVEEEMDDPLRSTTEPSPESHDTGLVNINGTVPGDKSAIRHPLPSRPASPAEAEFDFYNSIVPLAQSWTLYFSDTDKQHLAERADAVAQMSPGAQGHTASAHSYSSGLIEMFRTKHVADLFGKWKALRRQVATMSGREIEPVGSAPRKGQLGLGLHHMSDDHNFQFFVRGVKPMWEDKMCKMGGKFSYTGTCEQLDTLFFEIVLILVANILPTVCPSPGNGVQVVGVALGRKAKPAMARLDIWIGGHERVPPVWVKSVQDCVRSHIATVKVEGIKPVGGYKEFYPGSAESGGAGSPDAARGERKAPGFGVGRTASIGSGFGQFGSFGAFGAPKPQGLPAQGLGLGLGGSRGTSGSTSAPMPAPVEATGEQTPPQPPQLEHGHVQLLQRSTPTASSAETLTLTPAPSSELGATSIELLAETSNSAGASLKESRASASLIKDDVRADSASPPLGFFQPTQPIVNDDQPFITTPPQGSLAPTSPIEDGIYAFTRPGSGTATPELDFGGNSWSTQPPMRPLQHPESIRTAGTPDMTTPLCIEVPQLPYVMPMPHTKDVTHLPLTEQSLHGQQGPYTGVMRPPPGFQGPPPTHAHYGQPQYIPVGPYIPQQVDMLQAPPGLQGMPFQHDSYSPPQHSPTGAYSPQQTALAQPPGLQGAPAPLGLYHPPHHHSYQQMQMSHHPPDLQGPYVPSQHVPSGPHASYAQPLPISPTTPGGSAMPYRSHAQDGQHGQHGHKGLHGKKKNGYGHHHGQVNQGSGGHGHQPRSPRRPRPMSPPPQHDMGVHVRSHTDGQRLPSAKGAMYPFAGPSNDPPGSAAPPLLGPRTKMPMEPMGSGKGFGKKFGHSSRGPKSNKG